MPTNRIAQLLPGTLLCMIGAGIGYLVNFFVPTLSALLIAIVLGALLANLVRLPENLRPGIQFAAKPLLRAGIVLLGLQLVLGDIFALGWQMILVVIAIVFGGLAVGLITGKMLGLKWTQSLLIACGFSICGAAAVAAVDGVVDEAEEDGVATAVALVVIFGTIMIPLMPALSSLLHMTPEIAGMWSGGSIHEVAQVVAAGGIIGGGALSVAVVVKLARVLMLAPLMFGVSIYIRKQIEQQAVNTTAGAAVQQHGTSGNSETKLPPLVPLFVVGFLIAVVIRSLNIVPAPALTVAKDLQTVLLATAMFALGTGVHVSQLKKVGTKPFILATVTTLAVMAISLTGIWLTHPSLTA